VGWGILLNFPFQVDIISVEDVNQVPVTSGGNNVDGIHSLSSSASYLVD
jgi:hypothetical protein